MFLVVYFVVYGSRRLGDQIFPDSLDASDSSFKLSPSVSPTNIFGIFSAPTDDKALLKLN